MPDIPANAVAAHTQSTDSAENTATRSRPASGIRAIALYLPQFHPVPENDLWWGKGFTEWTNTAKAKPLFHGHYQPHIPADLGYYDLRLAESREAQAALARAYGVEAFAYYHYWFAGRRILERPFNEVLASGTPDFPFCLCWANETWSGVWHGVSGRTLLEQTYPGEADHRAHFDALLPAFRDRRYVTVDGKPVFMVYKPFSIPEYAKWSALWQQWARDAGLLGLHLIAMYSNLKTDAMPDGYDSRILTYLPHRNVWFPWSRPVAKISRKVQERFGRPVITDYSVARMRMLPAALPDLCTFPTIIPNWDNTPRSGPRGVVLNGSTPALFRDHVRRAVALVRGLPAERRFLFIKSWNEWAEGNHLEPDLRFGNQYLEALRDELGEVGSEGKPREIESP